MIKCIQIYLLYFIYYFDDDACSYNDNKNNALNESLELWEGQIGFKS